ncbi:MAG: DUF6597 domain-containing transcriptional factor [Patescibacteria group bacterium]
MYNPINDGIDKKTNHVIYNKSKPPKDLENFVDNFWELKTIQNLDGDFILHVIPDCCVNLLFNQKDTNIAAVTARQTTFIELNLGNCFHYIGVQLVPGVWNGNPQDLRNSLVNTKYTGELPLIDINKQMSVFDFEIQKEVLAELIRFLITKMYIKQNPVVMKILSNLSLIYKVEDMAKLVNLSPRQLQRVINKSTGFTPKDFLKVLKLQQSFTKHYLDSYSDQSHFIHSFKKSTGMTPGDYFKKFL